MHIESFKLERYFSKYEFNTKYLFSSSDCESLSMNELLVNSDKECLDLWNNLKFSYTDPRGNPLLLREIAGLYTGISTKSILHIVPEEGIYITMRTLINDCDEVICPFPAYQSLFSVVESQGGIIKKWKPTYDCGWRFDVDELISLVTSNTKMIIINFPHNPTGAMISSKDLSRIVAVARKNNCILFSDEMYRFLEYNPKDILPSVCEIYENGISLCGLSKSFSMAGARSGWLITKNDSFIDTLSGYKDYTTICGSASSEVLSIMAIRQSKRIIENNLQILEKNLTLLDSFFNEFDDLFTWTRPMAGPVGYVLVSPEISIDKLAENLIKTKNLMILPGSVYFDKTNAFRVGFGRNNIAQCIIQFKSYLDSEHVNSRE